jgi:hypothetical protein
MGVRFSKTSAKRIIRVVRAHEAGKGTRGVHWHDRKGGGSRTVLGTVSTTWTKGTTATVVRTKGDGSALVPQKTLSATNWFATVTVTTGTKRVAVTRIGGKWCLVAAEC